jgi:DNA-binding IclR family transcriptional regulator
MGRPRKTISSTRKPVSTNTRKDKSYYAVQSVVTALDILEYFQVVDAFGLDELTKRLRISKSAVSRLVTTLEQKGYIELNKINDKFQLGLSAFYLSQSFIHHAKFLHQAMPIIKEMSERCNESCYVAFMQDWQSVYLNGLETRQMVRVVSRQGTGLPVHCSAAGKVILAFVPDDLLDSFLAKHELSGYTERTITDSAKLKEHLKKIRQKGYAVNDEELETAVRGIAAPVFNHTGNVIAALVISGPAFRLTDERIASELADMARFAAQELSRRMGFLTLHVNAEGVAS